jgi:hypothetical protein
MLKNKDGSYNKVSLFLISLIMVIVIGMFGLSLPQITEISTLDIIIIIGLAGIICFGIYRKRIFKKISSMQSSKIPSIPSVQPSVPSKIKLQQELEFRVKPEDKPEITISSWILSLGYVSVGCIVLYYGSYYILNMLISSLPQTLNPEFASVQTSVTDTMSAAFSLMGIGMFVIMGVVIIKIVANMGNIVGRD